MLLFIGGAARTGKGILSRRLLIEKQMPYLSLDVLKMGLSRGVPEYEIDPNAGGIIVGERLWPLIYEMCRSLLFDDVDYVLEGEVLPKYVAALQQEYPSQVKSCFLGYATINPEEKLRQIRLYGGLPNDWPTEYSDDALLVIIKQMVEFSHYLRDECERCNLGYFDTSEDFLRTLDEAMAYIWA